MTLLENSEYTNLKDHVLLCVGSSERYNLLLSTLKEVFRNDINSPRRYEKITTIRQLLHVLEIRDVLSEDNVAPLKEIAQRLPNSRELLQKINEYETNHVPTEFVNYYASEITQKTSEQEQQPSVENTFVDAHQNTGLSARKKQLITETILEDIGVSWRDFARGLDIKEKIIDDLDKRHKEIREKAKCILELYNKRADENSWFFDMCDSLETCRRMRLVRKIQSIMDEQIAYLMVSTTSAHGRAMRQKYNITIQHYPAPITSDDSC